MILDTEGIKNNNNNNNTTVMSSTKPIAIFNCERISQGKSMLTEHHTKTDHPGACAKGLH